MGHIPLIHFPFLSSYLKGFSFKNDVEPCQVCPMARQQRISFPISSIKTNYPFQMLHIDIWGPYHECTYNDFKYFLTIVDDFTRTTWTHLMSHKSNSLTILKAFVTFAKTQFEKPAKVIRSDNDMEFCSHEANQFYSQKGILHQSTCVETPQQNGIVERKHKHLLETARALLFQSKLPIKFWGECVLHATYLIN